MKKQVLILLALFGILMNVNAQRRHSRPVRVEGGWLVPVVIIDGDTIPCYDLPELYCFKPLKFKNKRQQNNYTNLVRDVKKVLPIANESNGAII